MFCFEKEGTFERLWSPPLDDLSLLTADFFLLCVWGLLIYETSQIEVVHFCPFFLNHSSALTFVRQVPSVALNMKLIEIVDFITDTNSIKYLFFFSPPKAKLVFYFSFSFVLLLIYLDFLGEKYRLHFYSICVRKCGLP